MSFGPIPGVRSLDVGPRLFTVTFRDAARFGTLRTPDWARAPAARYAPGALVRTGRLKSTGAWKVQAVLIPRRSRSGAERDLATAVDAAWRIVARIEAGRRASA